MDASVHVGLGLIDGLVGVGSIEPDIRSLQAAFAVFGGLVAVAVEDARTTDQRMARPTGQATKTIPRKTHSDFSAIGGTAAGTGMNAAAATLTATTTSAATRAAQGWRRASDDVDAAEDATSATHGPRGVGPAGLHVAGMFRGELHRRPL